MDVRITAVSWFWVLARVQNEIKQVHALGHAIGHKNCREGVNTLALVMLFMLYPHGI